MPDPARSPSATSLKKNVLQRPPPDSDWRQGGFEGAIGQAIELGIGLKEIGNAASEMAIKLALEREQGNLHRAASRLGVTDRALQLRRAKPRDERLM